MSLLSTRIIDKMMDRKRLANVDLNLMLALEALIVEKSVTRAAERLGRSQPGLSSALARLRRHFGDDLLVRGPRGYRLTPFAAAMSDEVREAADYAERVFGVASVFDAATCTRSFTIMASDYVIHTLGPLLMREMTLRAPRARMRLLHPSEMITDAHDNLLRELDAWILPRGINRPTSSAELFKDPWVCIASADNATFSDQPTREDLRQAQWVHWFRHQSNLLPSLSYLRNGHHDSQMIVVESVMAAPALIAGTERLAVVPSRVVACSAAKVRILRLPHSLPRLVEYMSWDEARERDPAHRWLREVVVRCGRELDDQATP
ncbi:LysR family transcriptional regulator [Pseudonocardia xinjiangensis]|uniref:LysR family transcriptional regulator n=1 Tax=Pseudonocardia xinjiangensis TaxID=75289 RepID=A0ABX1R6F8_9PSEU|nr:LysR family transcriptional regulator [Pseudonocardia xinjiangensis]NMH75652.1 LysR family transcriptional regulator [Pseudonocardia xinjiangensis]